MSSKFNYKFIFEYSPSLTYETIEEIFQKRYPEYKISNNYGRKNLCKSAYVRAGVLIKQRRRQGKTIVKVYGEMSKTAKVFFGFIIHYLLRGTFIDDVSAVLKEELVSRYHLLEDKSDSMMTQMFG